MRKIFGALLMLIGLLLTLAISIGIVPILTKDISAFLKGANSIEYIIVISLLFVVFATFNFIFYFFGFRLMRPKKKQWVAMADEDFPSKLR